MHSPPTGGLCQLAKLLLELLDVALCDDDIVGDTARHCLRRVPYSTRPQPFYADRIAEWHRSPTQQLHQLVIERVSLTQRGSVLITPGIRTLVLTRTPRAANWPFASAAAWALLDVLARQFELPRAWRGPRADHRDLTQQRSDRVALVGHS